MVDVSIITSYIDIILAFVFDHIGAIAAIFIVFLGIRSSQKRKRRAQEESDGETPRKKTLRDIMAEMEAELNKTADDYEAEPEAEAEPEGEGPPIRPYGEQSIPDSPWQQWETTVKRQDAPWSLDEPEPEGPGKNLQKPLIFPAAAAQEPAADFAAPSFMEAAPAQSDILTGTVDLRTEALPMEVEGVGDEAGDCRFRKKNLDPETMVDAVVMAEILAKPRALRRAGQRL